MERGAANMKQGSKRFTVFFTGPFLLSQALESALGVQGLGGVLSSDLRLTRHTCRGTLNVRGKKDRPPIHKLMGS